jgi:hypothetical protein
VCGNLGTTRPLEGKPLSATETLAAAQAAGVRLGVNGTNLLLEADRGPPPGLLDALRENKLAMLALLRTKGAPAPLSSDDEEAIAEAIEERAAIREYDGGETREVAEREARAATRIYRALVAMPDDRPPRWVTMLLPGVDSLKEASEAAHWQFGSDRVIDVGSHQPRNEDTDRQGEIADE